MKKDMFLVKNILILASYLVFNTALFSFETNELNASELERLKKGELILKTKEISNLPWPEITIYTTIVAPALESFSLFAAYDLQKDYIPNLIKSTPIKHVTASDVHTEYELKMPFPLSNAHYIHGARIFKLAYDYKTEWYMVESSSSKDVRGEAYFKSFEDKTLLKYRSIVIPKSSLGKLVKNMMLKDVEQSIVAIKVFIEKTTKENPELVAKYTRFTKRAFDGEFVYQEQITSHKK